MEALLVAGIICLCASVVLLILAAMEDDPAYLEMELIKGEPGVGGEAHD